MFKKFRRTKVADLTVGRSLAFNFLVPIVQVAGYGVALYGAAAVWNRQRPATEKPLENEDTSEE